MRPSAPGFNLTGYCAVPVKVLTAFMPVERDRIEELYREAYEQARATSSAAVTERYAPSLN